MMLATGAVEATRRHQHAQISQLLRRPFVRVAARCPDEQPGCGVIDSESCCRQAGSQNLSSAGVTALQGGHMLVIGQGGSGCLLNWASGNQAGVAAS